MADAAGEYLRYIEHDRERKPSTVQGYRWIIDAQILPSSKAGARTGAGRTLGRLVVSGRRGGTGDVSGQEEQVSGAPVAHWSAAGVAFMRHRSPVDAPGSESDRTRCHHRSSQAVSQRSGVE